MTERDDAWVADGMCSKPVIATIPFITPVVIIARWEPNLWFVDKGQGRTARAVCAQCPVWLACLDYAIETRQDYGCWGGAGEQVRRGLSRILRDEGRHAFLVAAQDHMDRLRELAVTGVQPEGALNVNGPNATHGKAATYARGCRCDDCRDAIRESQQRNRKRRADGEDEVA